MKKFFLIALCLLFIFPYHSYAETKLKAVASFSIIADLVENIGGEHIAVQTIVAVNQDAHLFQPSPQDVEKLATADIIFINGLNFEGWISKMISNSGTKGVVVTTTMGVKPRYLNYSHGHEHHHHGHGHHDHGIIDPHAWQSLANIKIYVHNIKEALQKIDPINADDYEKNASNYLEQIKQLEEEVKSEIALIPANNKKVISSHDAFGYFADEYGIEFLAAASLGAEQQASAKTVANLIEQIRADKVKALFVENVSDPRLLKQIENDSKAVIGGKLYSDALSGKEEPASTYINMFRYNVKTIASALTE
jgi:zinc/manganese transport system substrate-binding protein